MCNEYSEQKEIIDAPCVLVWRYVLYLNSEGMQWMHVFQQLYHIIKHVLGQLHIHGQEAYSWLKLG